MHSHLIHMLIGVASCMLLACGPAQDPTAGLNEETPLAEIDRRILANPGSAPLFAERARHHERVDSIGTAVRDWQRAIELDSTNSAYHFGLGDLYFRELDMDKAENALVRASQLDPQATMPMLRLSELRLLQKRHREAMELANNVLRIDVHNAMAYYLKGWIHLEGGDTALAVSSYRTAVEQDPSMHAAYVQLGGLLALRNDPVALEYYRSALEITPNNVDALYGMAMYAQQNGMDSLALATYGRIVGLAPMHPYAWYNTGFIHLEHNNDPVAARTGFAQAVRVSPTYTEAYYNMGVTYERTGDLDSASVWYGRALKVDPAFTLAAEGQSRLLSRGVRIRR